MTALPGTWVATVADRPIPLEWVEERLASLRRGRLGRHLPPGESAETERLRRWIVQEFVARLVLLHEAEQFGLWAWPVAARDDDAGAEAAPEVPPAVVQRLFERVTGEVVVPEAEIEAYLAADVAVERRPEARLVSYAFTSSLRGAQAWASALRGGPPPETDETVRRGEMWLQRGEFVGPLEDALFEAAVDEVVGPFELEQGWAVARLDAVRPESRPSVAEARARIEAELLQHARTRAFDAWIDARRAELTHINPGFEHPGHPVHGAARHRH